MSDLEHPLSDAQQEAVRDMHKIKDEAGLKDKLMLVWSEGLRIDLTEIETDALVLELKNRGWEQGEARALKEQAIGSVLVPPSFNECLKRSLEKAGWKEV